MEGLESDPKVGEGISVTSVVGGSAHVHVCKPVSAYFISMYVYLCLCVYLCLQDQTRAVVPTYSHLNSSSYSSTDTQLFVVCSQSNPLLYVLQIFHH